MSKSLLIYVILQIKKLDIYGWGALVIINIQDDILKIQALGLLNRVLVDKTTKRNIMWATDVYNVWGIKYERRRFPLSVSMIQIRPLRICM